MSEKSEKPSHSPSLSDLDQLGSRLDAVKKKHQKPIKDDTDGSILGMAWRLSTELVVAVLVGAGLGYGLDTLFGTKPWFMLAGLGFGFAAGIKSVLRVAEKMDAQSAHSPTGNDIPDDDAED